MVFRVIAGGRRFSGAGKQQPQQQQHDGFVALDSIHLSSNSSMVVPVSSSLSSISGSMVVPGSSSSGSNRTEARDNSISAEPGVNTTSNLAYSSSMRGLVGLEAPDEGGIGRNVLNHQERRGMEYISGSAVVPSDVRPQYAECLTLLRGHAVLAAHTATYPGSAALHVRTPMSSPPSHPPRTGLLQLSWELRRWCAATGRLAVAAGWPSHTRWWRRRLGRRRCGRWRTTLGWGRYRRWRTTLGRGPCGRLRTTLSRGRCRRRRTTLGRGWCRRRSIVVGREWRVI